VHDPWHPVAGVMGAKRTSELLPFCHPLPLEDCQVDIRFDDKNANEIVIDCAVK
jgi:cyclic pyranopterin monophosphate synthase